MLKGILDEINYDKSLKSFFDNSYQKQFVFETMMLHELDEYMDKKTEGSIKFSIHNAKLGKKRWKSIYFEIIILISEHRFITFSSEVIEVTLEDQKI